MKPDVPSLWFSTCAICAGGGYSKCSFRVTLGNCPFSNWGVFECDIAHRRSVAVLCMVHNNRCNPMHHLYGSLPVPYVPVRVTRIALVTQR